MKYITLLILLLISLNSYAQSIEEGFEGHKWLSSPEIGMQLVNKWNNTYVYVNSNDNLNIGEGKAIDIFYAYEYNKLTSIGIKYEESQSQPIITYMFNTYGSDFNDMNLQKLKASRNESSTYVLSRADDTFITVILMFK